MSEHSNPKIVLIVEDDKDLSEELEHALVQKYYKVVSVTNLPEAMSKLNNQKFDAVLLDLHLERGLGEDILSGVKDDTRSLNFETPFIVGSGNVDTYFIEEHKRIIAGILVKPYDGNQLIQSIETVIAKSTDKKEAS